MINKSTSTVETVSTYMGKMFLKVGLGIFITFLTTVSCIFLLPIETVVFLNNPLIRIIAIIGEIAIIIRISHKVKKLSLTNINLWFYGLSLLNGVGLTYVFFAFHLQEIFFAAFAAATFFLSMGAYGYFTDSDLSHWGSVIKATLTAIFVLSILQFIIVFTTDYYSSFMSFCVSIAMVVILSLSTAFEMQNYKNFYLSNANMKKKEGLVTLGAMSLYLNYIIMFKHILRILHQLNNRNRR